MSRQLHLLGVVLAFASLAATGCQPTQPFFFHEDGDLSHYIGLATDINYPDVETCSLAEVEGNLAPLTLTNTKFDQLWDVRLEEAVRCALENGKVMRTLGGRTTINAGITRTQVINATDFILSNPGAVPTVYDPAITETSPGLGVESALAAFDTQLRASSIWQRNDRPQNVVSTGDFGELFTPVFEQDLGTFQAGLTKTNATGGTVSLFNNTVYDANNNPTRQVYSDWTTNFEAAVTQPLLQGAGVQFNRIAGPQNPFNGNGTLNFDGVVLARINMDVSLADFEAGVRNLVADVENAYWELYFAYRNLEARRIGRDNAQRTWRDTEARRQAGAERGRASDEAQSREQYFFFRGEVEIALADLYKAENRLRFLMGLAATDGRLIRPSDEPSTAKVAFEWHDINSEALVRSVDLRRQKWQIKRRELELCAAKNLLLPRLDAVARYRWLGLGDDLISSNRSGANAIPGSSAFESLTGGEFQEWEMGLNFIMPIGFRRELSTVRNQQLLLARERAILQDQELELQHALSDAIRDLETQYTLAQTQFNRRMAAAANVEAERILYESGAQSVDRLLDAQRRLAEAETAYYRAIVDYNRAILLTHFHKGSLLEYNGVLLAEGPWPGKAYFDAHKRARERDAAYFMNYGFTKPGVFSRGPYDQFGEWGSNGEGPQPVEAQGEEVTTPPADGHKPPPPRIESHQNELPMPDPTTGTEVIGPRLSASRQRADGTQQPIAVATGRARYPQDGTFSVMRQVNYDQPTESQAQPDSGASAGQTAGAAAAWTRSQR